MSESQDEPPVLFERDGHVAIITLNRPRVHNAINAEMGDAIEAHVAMVETDPAIRVAIIAARGKSFCAGADLKAVSAGFGQPVKARPGGFAGFVYARREKPWIAAVHANAYGGGVEIALACDMIVAAEDMAFTLPEVKRGLIPGAGGVIRAARFLPRPIALELVAGAAPLTARRAYELGMVNHLAPADRVLDEAKALASRIAGNAPLAVRQAMRLTRAAADVGDAELRALQEEAVEIVRASPDAAEGARAFVEKREPSWKLSMDYEIVAEGLNFPEGPIVLDDGQLIVCEVAGGRLMRIARDGKLSVFAETGGSPSGLAVGPDGAIYCCNNGGFDWDSAAKVPTRTRPLPDASRTSGGGMIQRIDSSTGKVETWLDSFEGRRLAGPNDLQFTPDGGFWFSDFGGWVDDGLRHGGLYRVEPDGSVRRSNFGICLNGVGVSPDGKTVYGAATYERWLLKFDASPEAGEQAGEVIADFPRRQFLDSLAMEADGTVAVAAFMENPGIMRVNPTTGACDHVPTPDEITTNIAFGGADMRDAYLSFSHGGTIARCRWPAPGLRLPFNL